MRSVAAFPVARGIRDPCERKPAWLWFAVIMLVASLPLHLIPEPLTVFALPDINIEASIPAEMLVH